MTLSYPGKRRAKKSLCGFQRSGKTEDSGKAESEALIDAAAKRPYPGGYSEGVPPVPIPNTAVKPFRAENTWTGFPGKYVTARIALIPYGMGAFSFLPGRLSGFFE